jgi:hypothetical protein
MNALRRTPILIVLTAASYSDRVPVSPVGTVNTALAATQTTALSTSQSVDADHLAYLPPLPVTTLTSYGWTATTPQTGVISC